MGFTVSFGWVKDTKLCRNHLIFCLICILIHSLRKVSVSPVCVPSFCYLQVHYTVKMCGDIITVTYFALSDSKIQMSPQRLIPARMAGATKNKPKRAADTSKQRVNALQEMVQWLQERIDLDNRG